MSEHTEAYGLLGRTYEDNFVKIVDRSNIYSFAPTEIYLKFTFYTYAYSDGSGTSYYNYNTLLRFIKSANGTTTLNFKTMWYSIDLQVVFTPNGFTFWRRMDRGLSTTYISTDSMYMTGFVAIG
ncbi:hypothetical protein D3C81_1795110 [compost metagenome]